MPSNKRGRSRDSTKSSSKKSGKKSGGAGGGSSRGTNAMGAPVVVALLHPPPLLPAPCSVPLPRLAHSAVEPALCSSEVSQPLATSLGSSVSDVIQTPPTPVHALSLADLRCLRAELQDAADAVHRQRALTAFQLARLSSSIAAAAAAPNQTIVAYTRATPLLSIASLSPPSALMNPGVHSTSPLECT
eukprot:TRINITY_DN2139_c1_g1_i1.p2 TRINITY_DN2139_c1_g1~~TRINITY_DN2139_c1_g1_i1.p2  ORF type:complete len:188 (+),score=39.05 TRINITY_DN2139_c1_g1_i1:149-712(+)